ncbi:MAG: Hpt domain-containing protein [Bacteroidetes bacterium]|nr:Hpt domain-containing protein [Bacteroidota bacterium]
MKYRYINTDYLEMVTGGNKEVTLDLLGIFRHQAAEFYSEMTTLNKTGNFSELGLLAHKAKSSVAIMGMENLAGMLKSMELSTKQENHLPDYTDTIETFRNETSEAIRELENYTQTL